MVLDDTIFRFAAVNIGKEESRGGFGGEKDSNMEAILKRKCEEGMRLNLDGRDTLELGYNLRRLK
jgi:hypothetical protein